MEYKAVGVRIAFGFSLPLLLINMTVTLIDRYCRCYKYERKEVRRVLASPANVPVISGAGPCLPIVPSPQRVELAISLLPACILSDAFRVAGRDHGNRANN